MNPAVARCPLWVVIDACLGSKEFEKLEEVAWGGLAWSALPSARRTFLSTIHGDTHPDDERRVLEVAYSLRREREASTRESAATPTAEP
jgi:hypothetical protein